MLRSWSILLARARQPKIILATSKAAMTVTDTIISDSYQHQIFMKFSLMREARDR